MWTLKSQIATWKTLHRICIECALYIQIYPIKICTNPILNSDFSFFSSTLPFVTT